MAEIVAANAPLLKEAGFRKRRHCFNRTMESGIVHLVNFWQAPKEPPAWTEVPGLRERLYGNYRIDVGVYVPEMTRSHTPRSSWINDYDCDLRRTIGQLITGSDLDATWWPLFEPTAEQRAKEALNDYALPWLASFPDQETILSRFQAGGPFSIGMSPAGALDIAAMLTGMGRASEARAVLETYVEQPVLGGHAQYLAEYLPKIGHGDLVPRVRSRDS